MEIPSGRATPASLQGSGRGEGGRAPHARLSLYEDVEFHH